MTSSDLEAAAAAIDLADHVVGRGVQQLAESGGPEVHQTLAYDLAHTAAGVDTVWSMLDYGAKGEVEARLTCAFVAEAVHDLREPSSDASRRGAQSPCAADRRPRSSPPTGIRTSSRTWPRRPASATSIRTSSSCRTASGAFADKEIAPVAEHVHRTNGDVPESIVAGLAEMGAFGLSVARRVRRLVRGW